MQEEGEKLKSPLLEIEEKDSPLVRKSTFLINELDKEVSIHPFKEDPNYLEEKGLHFRTIYKTLKKISEMSGPYVITSMTFFLINTVNLIFLGHLGGTTNEERSLSINVFGIATVYLNMFGFVFCLGAMHAFDTLGNQAYCRKDYNLFLDIFHSSKIFTFLFFVIFLLPACFCSHFLMRALYFDEQFVLLASGYIRIILLSMILNLFHLLNGKFLQIMGHGNLVMGIYTTGLVVHVISCLFLVGGLGLYGAAISSVVSSFFNFFVTCYFVWIYNPCNKNKSIILFDTDVLSTSKFFIYAKMGFTAGGLHLFNEIRFDLLVLLTYYLHDSTSLTANVLLYNYITLLYHFVVGFSYPITVCIKYYLVKMKYKKAINFLKNVIVIVFVSALVVTLFNFMCKTYIVRMFTYDLLVEDKFNRVINIFCFMIFVNWTNIIMSYVLQGMNNNKVVSVLSSLFFFIIFVPLGIFFAFILGYGYIAFWYALFAHMILFWIIECVYIIILDVARNIRKIIKDINVLVEDEDIFFK